MVLPFRHPDRLFQIFSLKHIREGEYISEPKLDGHYCVIRKDGPIKVLSRHNKPLSVSPTMLESLSKIGLSDGDELHGEWTSRRESNKNEGVYLFNWTFSKYEWLGSVYEEERHKKLYDLNVVDNIAIVEARTEGYAEHYKSTINNPALEGIVLKLRKARMIGDMRSPKDNPGYFKLKFRNGCAGDTLTIIPDSELITRNAYDIGPSTRSEGGIGVSAK